MRFRATTNFESGSAEDARALVEAWQVSEGLTIYVEALPDPTDNFTVIEGESQAGIVADPAPTPDPAPTGPPSGPIAGDPAPIDPPTGGPAPS